MSKLIDFLVEDVFINKFRNNIKVISEDTTISNGKAFCYFTAKMLANDIFFSKDNTGVRYFIVKYTGFTKKGSFKYQVERFDGHLPTIFDINNLKKGTKIKLKGRLHNN